MSNRKILAPTSVDGSKATNEAGNVPCTKFVVLMPFGRVGSNFLVTCLDASPSVHMANEFTTGISSRHRQAPIEVISTLQKMAFRQYFAGSAKVPHVILPSAKVRLSKAVAKYRVGDNSPPKRGAKLSVQSFIEPNWFAKEINDTGICVLELCRRNLIKTAISAIRAKEFAAYSRKIYGKAQWGVYDAGDVLPPSVVDVGELLRHVDDLEQHNSIFEKFCSNLVARRIRLDYSDLLTDLQSTLQKVCCFLGVELVEPRDDNFVKATSDNLREAISNFDEVHSALKGGMYETMLLEV